MLRATQLPFDLQFPAPDFVPNACSATLKNKPPARGQRTGASKRLRRPKPDRGRRQPDYVSSPTGHRPALCLGAIVAPLAPFSWFQGAAKRHDDSKGRTGPLMQKLIAQRVQVFESMRPAITRGRFDKTTPDISTMSNRTSVQSFFVCIIPQREECPLLGTQGSCISIVIALSGVPLGESFPS